MQYNKYKKKMKKVYAFLATGFEEVEALAPVDVLRRGGVDIQTVSIMGQREVEGAHGVTVLADLLLDECPMDDADLLMLPGGMPGAQHLDGCLPLQQALVQHHRKGKLIAAICAAPMVLGHLGLLQGRKATCYPGFQSHLEGAEYTAELVTVDGNIITGEGPAAAFPYAYTLLATLTDEATADKVAEGMMYKHFMAVR